MKTYHLRQDELWTRSYTIEADSPEDALRKYKASAKPDADFPVSDPQYSMDIYDGVEVYEA